MSTQLSYLSGTSTKPLLGITIGDMLDDIAARFPENDALIVQHQDIRFTYQQFKAIVDDCAKAFLALGVQKGDRVGIWSPNRYEWTVTQFATAKIGAILVNINPSYRLHELEYALNQSECSTVVIADQFKTSNFTEMLFALAPELQHCPKGELKAEKAAHLQTIIRMAEDEKPGMWRWDDFLQEAEKSSNEALNQRQSSLAFDEPINIQYTSGTTGFPKGATLSHHNILNNGYFVAELMNFTEKDRLVIPVPLYHCFGMVMGNLGCVTHGATMIYPSEGFDPASTLAAVEREKATGIFGVPTMFIAELDLPDFAQYDLTSLRTGIMAGSPCPIEVMKKVQSLMHVAEMEIAYGMTETSPVSTQTRVGTPLEKQVSTVGQIHPHLEVKIIDPETGRSVPRGIPGELCTRGYSVMLGYWNNETSTRNAIDKARWMHTGDLATMDEEGYVKIVGRIKDMIIRGGENIYPREIEEFLYTHPKISDVQVIGVPDAKYVEAVMAWIRVKEGETLSVEEVQAYCQGQIAHYKVPHYVRFTDGFPMTVTGKIRKVEMREQSIAELGLEGAAGIKTA
ncbi:AMP-binding protein [Haliscomenobacter sp.]|uniref:AMP-binding protein n=1 Tax=Haliscomenobacter sp. TaxID=2717303 RepID=UPI00359375E0